VPPQVGQVIFPTPEHLGHSFPFTFLAPLHIGHDIVFWPLQDLQLICHLSILYSEVLKRASACPDRGTNSVLSQDLLWWGNVA
jgi:hypothetical protein